MEEPVLITGSKRKLSLRLATLFCTSVLVSLYLYFFTQTFAYNSGKKIYYYYHPIPNKHKNITDVKVLAEVRNSGTFYASILNLNVS